MQPDARTTTADARCGYQLSFPADRQGIDSMSRKPASVWRPSRRSIRAGCSIRRRYPSDSTDRQWTLIRPLVIDESCSTRRITEASLRELVNAINYRWRTGCSWRMLPHDFPAWQTVYYHFHRWRQTGVLSKMRARLLSRSAGAIPRIGGKSSDSPDFP